MPKPIAALLATVAVALVLAPAVPAAEPTAVAYRPDLAQTPVLAGDRVLWIDGIVALDVFGAPAAGGPAGKLISAGADWPRPLSLAASPNHAALAFQEDSAPDRAGRQEYVYSRLLAGPSAGPLAFRGGSPDDASSGDRVHGADIAGDVLVAVRSAPGAASGVSDRPARITVQDLAAGGPETDLVAPSDATLGAHVSAAGAFVAYTAVADGVPAGGATPAGPCPRAKALVRPVRPAVALTPRRRAVRVRLSCPMAGEAGCRGRVVLSYTRRDGRPARLVKRGFTLARGTERKVRLRVSKAQLRALRGRGGNRLGLAVRTADEAGRVALAGDDVRLTRPKRRG